MTQYSLQLLLINILFYSICIFIAKPQITYSNPQQNNIKKGMIAFFFMLIINSVFAFWAADTYHSWGDFIIAKLYSNYKMSKYEAIYNWIAGISGNNYFLWRAYIWIPACLLIYYTAKRLDLLNKNFLTVMLLFGSFLAYTRGMLGHSMLIFSIVLLADKEGSSFSKILGLVFFCGSYFFHKSMFINITFALLALFPFEKKSIVISLILFPFLTAVATYLVDGIASGQFDLSFGDGVGGTGDRTALYATQKRTSFTFYGIIGKLIEVIPQYLVIFYLYKKVILQKLFEEKNIYKYLFRLTYVEFYIASLFFFVETSPWIYERFKYMGFFPMIFVLSAIWSKETSQSKLSKSIILLQTFALLFWVSYKFYKW
jgi:hypothetical protein